MVSCRRKFSSCFGTDRILDRRKGWDREKKKNYFPRRGKYGIVRGMLEVACGWYWVNCDETNDVEIFLRIHRSLEIDTMEFFVFQLATRT